MSPSPELQVDSAKVLIPLFFGSIAAAVLALFLPLWTLRKRLRREKARTLERIGNQLRRLRDDRRRGKASPPGAEADLIARRNFVEEVPESAIDTGSFRRLSIYLLFPAGSWFVGPVARKMVDAVFLESAVGNLLEWFQ